MKHFLFKNAVDRIINSPKYDVLDIYIYIYIYIQAYMNKAKFKPQATVQKNETKDF